MLKEIRELFDYDAWANRRAFDATASLTEEQLHRQVGGSFPSIYETLHHIVSAEWIWLMRWMGERFDGPPPEWQRATLAVLREGWETEVVQRRESLLDGLTEDRLADSFDYLRGVTWRGPLIESMRHVVNHSTYHRGQVTSMIRQVGGEPINTDLIGYYREKGSHHPA